jgi:hypothetical protein
MGLRPLDKTRKPPDTVTVSAPIEQSKSPVRSVASGPPARYVIASGGEKTHPKERHFLPGSSAGVSVPKT